MDSNALFKIGYGLYVLTAREGEKDNGCIVNTVMQVMPNPATMVLGVCKQNYTHDMIARTGEFNVSMLTQETPFKVFEHFGFQSGKNVNKFADCEQSFRSENGILYLPKYTNAMLSGKVTQQIDMGSHTLFVADITQAKVLSDVESVTYSYYQANIKPKPQATSVKGWRCKICGYVYEGENLPADFICPLCKHGAADFEKI
ncbi:MAG: flavin reductase [Clostridia bacterium]|nr:flavin reductase [Clostridia bacterium]NLS84579.1 flavin reductase [Oscillospiraceae bacterium]